MHITMASTHKPKSHEAPVRRRGRGRRPASMGAPAPTPSTDAGRSRDRRQPSAAETAPPAAAAPAAERRPNRDRTDGRTEDRTGRSGGQARSRGPETGSGRQVGGRRPSRQPPKPAASGEPRPGPGGDEERQHTGRPSRSRQESEATVPKIKSHKAAQKRIGVTGSGKVIRVKAWRGHHLEIKSSRRTRRYAGKALIGPEHAKQVRRLLPYL